MAYKKLIKVSNVCQVLDKSKYNPSQTINGVTFTNNGDGTITVNGTATSRALYGMYASRYFPSTLIGHKCLIKSNVPSLDSNIMTIHSSAWEVSDAKPIGELVATSNIYISVFQGYTVNNIIFKPQLFDLTEMYGAGHEPTTVEEFRQDFPNDLYDYSPHCWLTSYKRVFMTGGGNYLTSYQRNLTCKTKNLFDINRLKGINDFDVYGNSLKCFRYATTVYDISVLNIFKSLKPNTIYTMSATVNKYISNATGRISLVFNDGSIFILFSINKPGYYYRSFSLTQTQIDSILSLTFYGEAESAGGPIIWSNIQLELGDTATDYVPYGHL